MLLLATAILSASVHLAGLVDVPAEPAGPVPTVGVVAVRSVPLEGDRVGRAVVGDGARPVVDDLGDCRSLREHPEGSELPAGEGSSESSAAGATTGSPTDDSAPGGPGDDPRVLPCLSQLGRASSGSLTRFADSFDPVGDDASRVSSALVAGTSAAGTADWWAGLDPSRRLGLVAALPGVVGQLEGVPYAVRDQANRLFLTDVREALHERDDTPDEADDDDRRAAMLAQVQAALLDRSAGDADRELVTLDTVLPGRAAVSVGHLDTADDVTVLVPGMFFTVRGQMVDWTETAGQLLDEQRSWTYLLARSDPAPLDSVAVVAWMGYRTPDLTNVYTLDLAERGAQRLEEAVGGLDASRASHAPRVTVVAHSYGSTTATLALSSGRTTVDSLVLLGSPGSVVPTADDLDVAGHDVYAAAGSFDPVAGSGYFGADPGTAAFGAVKLHTGGGDDTVTGRVLAAALGHNDYLRPGTESMRSLALIALGRGDLADGDERNPGEPAPEGPELALVRPQDVYLRD